MDKENDRQEPGGDIMTKRNDKPDSKSIHESNVREDGSQLHIVRTISKDEATLLYVLLDATRGLANLIINQNKLFISSEDYELLIAKFKEAAE